MSSTFKILMYLKKGSEKPNGNMLFLMYRLTVGGEIKQFSCKMNVPPRLWNVKTSRASGKSIEAQKINHTVDKIRVDVNRRYQEMMPTDGYVTATKLKDAYLGIGIKQETLFHSDKLKLSINGQNILGWLKEQFDKLREAVKHHIKPTSPTQKQSRGI